MDRSLCPSKHRLFTISALEALSHFGPLVAMLASRASQSAHGLFSGLSTPAPKLRAVPRSPFARHLSGPRRHYAAPSRDASVFPRRTRLRFNPPPKVLLACLIAPSVGLFGYAAYAGDRAQRGSVCQLAAELEPAGISSR